MTNTKLSTRFPRVFPSRALLDRNSTPKQDRIPPTLCRPHSVPPQILRQLCTPWEGQAISSSLQPQQVSTAKSLPHDGGEMALDKTTLTHSLSGPVSPRGTELPTGDGNRFICLHQGSCCHFEMLWPQKMPHTAWKRHSHKTLILFLSFNGWTRNLASWILKISAFIPL